MVKSIWIAALVLALAAPIAGAEDTSASSGFFEELVAQVVAAVVGPGEPTAAALGLSSPGPETELGEHMPVGG